MANYLTTDTDLTAVADAIRTKGGTSSPLTFPQGFVDAIGDIETGGGGTDYLEMDIAGRSYTYHNSNLTEIRSHGFNSSPVTLVDAPNVVKIYASAFTNSKITRAFYPNGATAGANCFGYCTSLQTLVIKGHPGSFYSNLCYYCGANLVAVDLINATHLCANDFNHCSGLKTIVLRRTSAITEMAALTALNNNTPFASGNSGGTIYVPQALIATYQSATNWATILGYGSGEQNQILPIEGSIYETQYVDGTPIPTT